MALMKISGAGLSAIAMLVALLWACILGEHLIVQRANEELSGAMTRMRLLQKKRQGTIPVSLPASSRPLRPAIG